MDLFETLHTSCGHIGDGFVMELELNLAELQHIEFSHFRQLFALKGMEFV